MAQGTLNSTGRRLRFMREAKGLTQTDVAKAVHATQPTVARWENDERRPTALFQQMLADALGASRSFLFEGPEDTREYCGHCGQEIR